MPKPLDEDPDWEVLVNVPRKWFTPFELFVVDVNGDLETKVVSSRLTSDRRAVLRLFMIASSLFSFVC